MYGSWDADGEAISCEFLKDDNKNYDYKIVCGYNPLTNEGHNFSVFLINIKLDPPSSQSDQIDLPKFESKSLVEPIKYISSSFSYDLSS